jgi:hypothetical protein
MAPGRRAAECCRVTPKVFSIVTAVRSLCTNTCHSTRTEQKAPDNSQVYKSLQNCGFSAQKMLPVNILAPEIWWWLLDFWEICGPLISSYQSGKIWLICQYT